MVGVFPLDIIVGTITVVVVVGVGVGVGVGVDHRVGFDIIDVELLHLVFEEILLILLILRILHHLVELELLLLLLLLLLLERIVVEVVGCVMMNRLVREAMKEMTVSVSVIGRLKRL